MSPEQSVIRRYLVNRDVGLAFLVLAGSYFLAETTTVQALQVPGYLVMVGFDLIQNPLLPGLTGVWFDALFAVYVYALAVVIAAVARALWSARPGRTARAA